MLAQNSLRQILVKNKNRIAVGGAFLGLYGSASYYWRKHENEIVRMAIAGSVSNCVMECSFHFADTVNIRSKVHDTNISSFSMVAEVYNKDGLHGFAKGFSACFYGSVACGFIYFGLYKLFKNMGKEKAPNLNYTLMCFMSAFIAEAFTLIVYYPYDMFKCRL